MRLSQMQELKNPAPFLTMDATENLDDAVRSMAMTGQDAIVVTSDGGQLCGIFTEHDLVKRVIARDIRDLESLHLRDVMTYDVISAHIDESAFDVLDRMDNNRHRHIPVLNEAGHVTALLSDRDFLAYSVPEAVQRTVEAGRALISAKYQPFLIATAVVLYTLLVVSIF